MYDLQQLTQDTRNLIEAADEYAGHAEALRNAGELDSPEYRQSCTMATGHFLSAAYTYCGIAWEAIKQARKCDLGWAPQLHAIAQTALECAEEARALGTRVWPSTQSSHHCAERSRKVVNETDLAERNADQYPFSFSLQQVEYLCSCVNSAFRQGNGAAAIELMNAVALDLSGFINRLINSPGRDTAQANSPHGTEAARDVLPARSTPCPIPKARSPRNSPCILR
jgi:hypothetical protein